MSTIANVVINDMEATPIAHTFLPVQQSPVAKYRENVVDIPVAGQGTITVALTNKSSLYKVRVQLEMPVMEEATAQNAAGYTAAPKTAHTLRADVTFFAHSRTTEQQRKNLIELFSNAMDNAQVRDTYTSLIKAL